MPLAELTLLVMLLAELAEPGPALRVLIDMLLTDEDGVGVGPLWDSPLPVRAVTELVLEDALFVTFAEVTPDRVGDCTGPGPPVMMPTLEFEGLEVELKAEVGGAV